MTYRVRTPTGTVEAERVTHVIRSVLAAPALERWKLRQVAMHAATQAWDGRFETPGACIEGWERTTHGRADQGSRLHAWIAAVLAEGGIPALSISDKAHSIQVTSWLADHPDLVPIGVETTVTTASAPLVAGTLDALFAHRTTGHITLVDWKTTKGEPPRKAYFDHQVQLGAYLSLPDRLTSAGEIGPRVPPVDCAMIVYVGPHAAKAIEVPRDRARTAWSHVRGLWEMQR